MDLSIVLSILLGFVVSAVAGRLLIPALRRLKAGQAIKEIGPTWHMTKQGTPTMGGLMFIIAIAAVLVVIGWKDLTAGRLGGLYTYLFALVFGAIGFLDDYMKVKKKENTGLTAGPKFLLQLAAAIVFTILLRNEGYLSPDLYIPFVNVTFQLPWVVYMVFAAFVMVGTVNAVNITDGIDGLSSSVTVPVAMFFTIVAAQWDRGEIGVLSGALVGGLLGFSDLQFPSGQGLYGRHRLSLHGRHGVRPGLCAGYAPDPGPGGGHLHRGDALRHHPGDLFQSDTWQADLPDGAPPSPLRDGRLERSQAGGGLYRRDRGILCAGLPGVANRFPV